MQECTPSVMLDEAVIYQVVMNKPHQTNLSGGREGIRVVCNEGETTWDSRLTSVSMIVL